ncbi:MAG TPA: glutathione transferase GstA [Kofleriaceae bacterium]|jgi:glutathione S-transferase
MADYSLYYAPSGCSLSPHIALREAGASFDLVEVDIRNKKLVTGDGDWLAINPKGYIAALKIPGGEVITEGAVIVRYIADQFPAAKLAPPNGTIERVRVDEWLNFIATELHKGFLPLYKAAITSEADQKDTRDVKIPARFALLEQALQKHEFLAGPTFSIVDGYLFYALRSWQHHLKQTLDAWPTLAAYYQRLAQRPAIIATLAAEGITA